METFKKLVETQVLNEFGEILNAIGTGLNRRISAMPDKIQAKFGSDSAKGRLNLSQYIAEITDNFQTYCAEQKIKHNQVTVEDFFEFLYYKYGFDPDTTKANTSIYQANPADAAKKDEINGLADQLGQAIIKNEPCDQPLSELVDMVKTGDPSDSAAARKALWTVSRANPSANSIFANFKDQVGVAAGAQLGRFIEQAAMFFLKTKDRGAASNDGNPSSNANARTNPQELNVGLVPLLNVPDLIKDKWSYQPLLDKLGQYGLSKDKLRDYAQRVLKSDAKTLTDLAEKMDRDFHAKQCINLSRILLECFTRSTDWHCLNPVISDFKGTKAQERQIENTLKMSIKPKRNEDGEIEYDGTAVNNSIYKIVNNEVTTAKLLLLLIGCLSTLLGGL